MDIVKVLRDGFRPALGCTEPAAVAYAAALAAQLLGGEISQVKVTTDMNVYKNGMGVYVPGTDRYGLEIAAAVGAIGGDPDLELQVLGAASAEEIKKAYKMVSDNKVIVRPNTQQGRLYIEATVHSDLGYATVFLEGAHTNVTKTVVNGFERTMASAQDHGCSQPDDLHSIPFTKYCAAILALPVEQLTFVREAAHANAQVAKAGMEHSLGIGLGARYSQLMQKGLLSADIANEAMMVTAAAADARMHGWPEPVMSVDGSGNQGITATLPVLTVAQRLKSSDDDLTRALALSEGVTLYVKRSIGKLSALCACAVAAAIGAACGVTYLLGGEQPQIEAALKNVTANLTGMICDGAKPGCSFKLATAANCAVQSAMLSMEGVEVGSTDGIVTDTVDGTIVNLGRVSNPGMVETDRVIVEMMRDKSQCASS